MIKLPAFSNMRLWKFALVINSFFNLTTAIFEYLSCYIVAQCILFLVDHILDRQLKLGQAVYPIFL
uniref:ABC transmembrane type-1 domain-containing protein n=1 Tax=Anguilla anguilla TaxID=7936 RepID=A0A0E9WL58_ANGAN